MKQISLALSILLLFIECAHAQTEKRIRRDDLVVRVTVSITPLSDGYLRFKYVFENDPNSHQPMHRAIVDLNDNWTDYGGSLRNVIPPKEKDWGESPTVGDKMRWVTYYDTTGADILERPPRSVIGAGERLSFSFEARGLPGIGNFWAAGWAKWSLTTEEKDSLLREGYDWDKSRAVDDNFYKGITPVRRTPPNPFIPLAFLDTLLSYSRQSVELGWLKVKRDEDAESDEKPDDGIVGNLDKRLQRVKADLLKDRTKEAKQHLRRFIRKVESIWAKSQKAEKMNMSGDILMTSEAYALLFYNAEYLFDHLPDKKSGDQGKKK